MAWSPSSPLTGAAQTGFTSPTYTLSADNAPSSNGRQYAITAVGGTQSGVTTTGAATPFTLSFFKPTVNKVRGLDASGRAVTVPTNVYKQITRKSVALDGFGTTRVMLVTTIIEVPAGAESTAPSEVRAALSCHIGALSNASAGIGDTVIQGVL